MTMPWRCAFDLVTSVRCLRARLRASSKAKRWMRSTPTRVKTATSLAVSIGSPRCTRPPTPEYSPSEFSRITTQSMSRPLASGLFTPGSTRAGRTLAYWSKPWQIGSLSPQSDTWSGTFSLPTAPKKIASKVFSFASPPSGM